MSDGVVVRDDVDTPVAPPSRLAVLAGWWPRWSWWSHFSATGRSPGMGALSRSRAALRARVAGASIAVALLVAACQQQPDGLVARPPSDAPPSHVVQALIDATNARDADLVRTVATPGWAEVMIEEWSDVYLTGAEIGTTVTDGNTASVNVSFIPVGGDASMPNGQRVGWAFLLTNESGRWLVTSMGQG